ncbi:hypothetical protein Q9R29_03825 [Rothia sp. ARF10]|nr:hypothetical protein [Rothia sp. ARF10]
MDVSRSDTRSATLRRAAALALATAVVAVVSAVWTGLDPGLLHGPAAMQGSARGTAVVLGAMAVPVLLASVRRALRGSAPALVIWGGALLYVVYNALLFLFLTPFNAAFLAYVVMLGIALWATGYLLATPEVWRAAEVIARRAPGRAIAAYVWVVVLLNTLAWLANILPSLGKHPAPMLEGTGVATNAIYVQDLALWLPLAAVAALWLRRREPRGSLVVGAVLGMWVIESVSIAVDQSFGVRADPSSPVVSLAVIPPFVALAVVGLVPLWLLLRTAREPEPGSGRASEEQGRRSLAAR